MDWVDVGERSLHCFFFVFFFVSECELLTKALTSEASVVQLLHFRLALLKRADCFTHSDWLGQTDFQNKFVINVQENLTIFTPLKKTVKKLK